MAMTGGGGRGLTIEERDEFLRSGAKFIKIATTNEDGWPMISPVWYDWDGSSFFVVGKARTSYVQNLRRNPRCGLLVGAEMLGPDVEHTGHLLAWAVQQRLDVHQALAMPFYHPVTEEGIRTALRDLRRALRFHGHDRPCAELQASS